MFLVPYKYCSSSLDMLQPFNVLLKMNSPKLNTEHCSTKNRGTITSLVLLVMLFMIQAKIPQVTRVNIKALTLWWRL